MFRSLLAVAGITVLLTSVAIANNVSAAPPSSATQVFNGDYSSGDFTQWPVVQNVGYNSYGKDYVSTYSAAIVNDAVKGKVARFEVRAGDSPFLGTERSEVSASTATGGTEGQTRWYQFSTMFDRTFPQNHADLGFGVTNQWHQDNDTAGSPPVSWDIGMKNGYWSLTIEKQSAPGVYIRTYSILDLPLNVGQWHDIKMKITWSTSDTIGAITVWHNGVQQTFLDGSTTYRIRTLIPGTTTTYYKEGYYRKAMQPTGIVYHTGFRIATDEAGL